MKKFYLGLKSNHRRLDWIDVIWLKKAHEYKYIKFARNVTGTLLDAPVVRACAAWRCCYRPTRRTRLRVRVYRRTSCARLFASLSPCFVD